MDFELFSRCRRRRLTVPRFVMLAASLLIVASIASPATSAQSTPSAWMRLLGTYTNLGPSHEQRAVADVVLERSGQSVSLESWARLRGLSVQWFTGQQFATVTGPALLLGRAFGVTIDSYRLSPGRDFYAAAVFPRVPSALHGVVRAIGQITSYLDF